MTKMKKIFLIITFFFTFVICNKVYAGDATINWATVSTGGGGGGTPGEYVPPSNTETYGKAEGYGNKQYNCTYNYEIKPSTNITMNSYDSDGNLKMNETTKINGTFASGTWIGLRIKETRNAEWNVFEDTFSYTETRKKYTCEYKWEDTWTTTGLVCTGGYDWVLVDTQKLMDKSCPIGYSTTEDRIYAGHRYVVCKDWEWKCLGWKSVTTEHSDSDSFTETKIVSYSDDNPCIEETKTKNGKTYKLQPVAEPEDDIITIQPDATLKEACESDAMDFAIEEAKKYINNRVSEVKYIDTNEYIEKIEDTLKTLTYESEVLPYKKDFNGTLTRIYSYRPEKVCMNVKTSNVRYIQTKGEECGTDELTVPSGIGKDNQEYWQYFIPLNTKTGSKFYIKLEKTKIEEDEPDLSKEECYSVMKNYPLSQEPYDYTNYIIKANGDDFEGKEAKDKRSIRDLGGCNFSTAVNIDVIQKFYGEETSENGTIKFNGFNFYYRPIDISNPFPNGVANNSLWEDVWNKDRNDETNDVRITDSTNTTTTIDLSKSFATITYVASSMNKNKVKNYNDNYANWTNTMDADGTSKFINSGIVNRNIPKNSYYKLGCGPSNKDWEECK